MLSASFWCDFQLPDADRGTSRFQYAIVDFGLILFASAWRNDCVSSSERYSKRSERLALVKYPCGYAEMVSNKPS